MFLVPSYSMAPKFDPLIPRYTILILRYASIARDHAYSHLGEFATEFENILQHESGA
jgi:hypothetical protein